MSLVPHDLDGDGDLDVVLSDRTGSRRGVFWLENPGWKPIATITPGASTPLARGIGRSCSPTWRM